MCLKAVTKYHDNLKLIEPKKKPVKEATTTTNEITTTTTSTETPSRKRSPKEILLLTRNLPLLPADKLEEGLLIVAQKIEELVKEWPDLEIFKNYLYNQWAGKANLLACFGKVVRTNNPSEAFNRTLVKRLGGKHPHLLVFLFKSFDKINSSKEFFPRHPDN